MGMPESIANSIEVSGVPWVSNTINVSEIMTGWSDEFAVPWEIYYVPKNYSSSVPETKYNMIYSAYSTDYPVNCIRESYNTLGTIPFNGIHIGSTLPRFIVLLS
jgi:hypothetical protein